MCETVINKVTQLNPSTNGQYAYVLFFAIYKALYKDWHVGIVRQLFQFGCSRHFVNILIKLRV